MKFITEFIGGPVIGIDSKEERHVLVGTVHGAFANCKKYLPGMFVEADDYNVLQFLQKEVFGSACDARGTFSEADGNCTCKKYVSGKNCNECVTGTWNLLQTNELGCQSKYLFYGIHGEIIYLHCKYC